MIAPTVERSIPGLQHSGNCRVLRVVRDETAACFCAVSYADRFGGFTQNFVISRNQISCAAENKIAEGFKGFRRRNLAWMREFYETEAVAGNWSTRELERQINSHFFERTGASIEKRKMLEAGRASEDKYRASARKRKTNLRFKLQTLLAEGRRNRGGNQRRIGKVEAFDGVIKNGSRKFQYIGKDKISGLILRCSHLFSRIHKACR